MSAFIVNIVTCGHWPVPMKLDRPCRPSQTSSQTELENWITAIHSSCAAALARQQRGGDTVRLLRFEIRKLEQKIDMDEKMKKMADMQLSTVPDNKKRKTILEQVKSPSLTQIKKWRNCLVKSSITTNEWRSFGRNATA